MTRFLLLFSDHFSSSFCVYLCPRFWWYHCYLSRQYFFSCESSLNLEYAQKNTNNLCQPKNVSEYIYLVFILLCGWSSQLFWFGWQLQCQRCGYIFRAVFRCRFSFWCAYFTVFLGTCLNRIVSIVSRSCIFVCLGYLQKKKL